MTGLDLAGAEELSHAFEPCLTNKIDELQPLPSPATSTPDPNLCRQLRLAPLLDWTAVGVYFYRHGKNVLPLQLQAHYQPR